MALPLILRNCSRSQGLSNLLKTGNFSVQSRKTYLQLVNQAKTTTSLNKQTVIFDVVKRGMSADHSKLWPIEKAVSVALLGIVPATFLTPNIILDDLFAILVVAHFHWGLEACVVDYIRPILFGAAIPKISLGLLYLISAATLGGLLYYNHHCSGIGCTVRKFWKLKVNI